MSKISWCEKYRPSSIENMLSHEHLVTIFKNVLNNNKSLPHILLYGPSGTGKTLIIQNFIKQLYGYDNLSDMTLELDAIDERGIKTVRDRIKNFAKKSIPYHMKEKNINFKLIILDEAETITTDAQTSLRRCIESYSYITRFCIICNDINKIINPIQSRCSCFYFSTIDNQKINQKLLDICKNEKIKYDKEAIEKIINISDGDYRKNINNLQYIYSLYNNVSLNNVNNYYLFHHQNNIETLINDLILNNKYSINEICNKIFNNGLDILLLLKSINLFISKNKLISDIKKSKILIEFIEIENRLIKGSDEFIQLMYLFYHIKYVMDD